MTDSLPRYDSFADVPTNGRTVVSIGNFDGVHVGHQEIMRTARRAADERRLQTIVVTFDPPPAEVLFPDRTIDRLTTTTEKMRLLARAGIDSFVVLRTSRALLEQSPLEFLSRLVEHLRPAVIVEGPDFHFGKNRAGTIATLREHAAAHDYEVIEVPPTPIPLATSSERASSSAARKAIATGDVARAASILARPHRITGTVGSGDGRGAKMGIATANLDEIPQLTPGIGVYAALAQLADDRVYPAAVNIGPQPTFAGMQHRVEAHVIGFTADLRGQKIALNFLDRLRDQVKFANAEALVTQIKQDIRATVDRAATANLDADALLPIA